MQVKVCPVCGALVDSTMWLMDTCPVCETKQENNPWKIVNLKEEA